MAYVKQSWVDKTATTPGTKISRARLEHIEDGIEQAHDLAEAATGGSLVVVDNENGTATIGVGP